MTGLYLTLDTRSDVHSVAIHVSVFSLDHLTEMHTDTQSALVALNDLCRPEAREQT